MRLNNATASVFVPDGRPISEALKRITRVGIGAHQDDLEFMAFHGIAACYDSDAEWFGGVTCTNGSGSPRAGVYASFTDSQMTEERHKEQDQAAIAGCYGVMIQLGYPSSTITSTTDAPLQKDIQEILLATRPKIVYTHNPADKHETHIGVAIAVLKALRALPRPDRPSTVWGCEMWRDLDWLPDEDKVLMDLSGKEALATMLNSAFKSQIAGGKRYDLGILGRRRAHGTFLDPRATDKLTEVAFGIDLSPLVTDESLEIVEYVCSFIDKFKSEVRQKLKTRLGS